MPPRISGGTGGASPTPVHRTHRVLEKNHVYGPLRLARSTGTGPELPVDLAAASEPLVSIIIPALNEARNLPHVMARLPEVDEVILVDGGSTDDTVDVARRLMPGIRVVRQNRRGKGNALACGFAAATGDIMVMIDADGSTDPGEIPSFIAALRAGADFAKGSRFGGARRQRRHHPGAPARQQAA